MISSLTSNIRIWRLAHTDAPWYGGPLSANTITADRMYATSDTLTPVLDKEFVTKYYVNSISGGSGTSTNYWQELNPNWGKSLFPLMLNQHVAVSGSKFYAVSGVTGFFGATNSQLQIKSQSTIAFYVGNIQLATLDAAEPTLAIAGGVRSDTGFFVSTSAIPGLFYNGGTTNSVFSQISISGGIITDTPTKIALSTITAGLNQYWKRVSTTLSPINDGDNLAITGTLDVGSVSTLTVAPAYAGLNDIPSGILVNTSYRNLSFIPRGDGLASTAGFYGYNGASWKSVVEYSNEGSANPTLRISKNGGFFAFNTHSANYQFSISGNTSISGNFYSSSTGFMTGFAALTTGRVTVGSNSAAARFTVSSNYGVVAAFLSSANGVDQIQVWRHPTQKSMWVDQYGTFNTYQYANSSGTFNLNGSFVGTLVGSFLNENTGAGAGYRVSIGSNGGGANALTIASTGTDWGIGGYGGRGTKSVFTLGGEGASFGSATIGNVHHTQYVQGAGNAGEVVEYNRTNQAFGAKWLGADQFTVWGNFKVSNPNTYGGGLGREILADNLVLSGSGKWTANADFSLPASGAQFTYSTGTGYISQTAANFLTPLKPNTHYLLAITYSGVAGSPYFVIPDPNGTFHTPVSVQSSQSCWQFFQDIANTTRYYVLKTQVDNSINGLPLIIKAFSAAAGAFKITNISLKEITGGTIDTQGTFASGIQTLTASFTAALSAMTWLCDATAGALTASLPSASASYRKMMNVKKIDSSVNQITIKASSPDLIDGATEQKISSQWASISLHCNGVNWYII